MSKLVHSSIVLGGITDITRFNLIMSVNCNVVNCTVYHGQVKSITASASIIHGSGIGPAAYVVYASDLKTVIPGKQLCKFADLQMTPTALTILPSE